MDKPAVPGARLLTGAELENLPSFGMSTYVNLESGAETAAMLEKIKDGKYRTQREHCNDQVKLSLQSSSTRSGPSRMPPPTTSTSIGQPIQVFIQDDKGDDESNSATAPISSTVDVSQIMETEGSSVQSFGVATRPELQVKMMTDYMRFRYMSEKCPKKKGAKTRHYETDDTDKHCLAEINVLNYNGIAKVVAYCVYEDGRLHPYNLFGDCCHSGVFVHRYKFRPGRPPLKLHKVSITTPRAREYKENQKNQLAILSEAGIHDIKFCDEVDDKQIVYVMFKVILDDFNGEILSKISTPIQNKKKGKEFRIDDVEPVSAPANGEISYNINRNRVMLHVTEDTAFPSEVGVKIRERDASGRVIWEKEPDQDKIFVIKQCVVKFIPPPYKNPQTKEDVEVEICLYDKKTKKETDPFKFVYKGSDIKTKKRKLDEDISMPESFVSENFVKENRKFLSAIRTRPSSSSSEGQSDGSSPDNSMSSMQEMQSANTEEGAVSLREQRTGNGQLPFTSYAGNEGTGQNAGDSYFGSSNSQTVSHSHRPQSAGFSRETSGTSQPAGLNQSSVVTSTTSVFGPTTQTATYHNAPTTMSTIINNTSTSNQPQPSQDPSQDNQYFILSEEDKLGFAQQGVQLPKLGPNQMLALIGGQIFVVNDDTADQTTNVTPPPVTYNPPAVVQNIGNQQVTIQQVAPQQPASEAEQRQLDLSPNMTQVSFQMQTASNMSQTVGNPQYGVMSSTSSGTSQPQTAVRQQQNLQQQLFDQQIAQIAALAGHDINQPGVYEQILQLLQTQASQQGAHTGGASGVSFGSGSDLNDDDIEIDGGDGIHFENSETNDSIERQITQAKGTSDRRNKKLRASSSTESDSLSQNKIIIEVIPGVEEVDDSASRIPVFVNEVTVGDESSDSDSYGIKVQTGKAIDYKLKNGSFGNDIHSEDEDDT